MTERGAEGPRTRRLRRLAGDELARHLLERQRAYYVWIGSPYGLREEDFRLWITVGSNDQRRDRPDSNI